MLDCLSSASVAGAALVRGRRGGRCDPAFSSRRSRDLARAGRRRRTCARSAASAGEGEVDGDEPHTGSAGDLDPAQPGYYSASYLLPPRRRQRSVPWLAAGFPNPDEPALGLHPGGQAGGHQVHCQREGERTGMAVLACGTRGATWCRTSQSAQTPCATPARCSTWWSGLGCH